MLETPTTEPTHLTAGDTVRWRKQLPGYAPADWELQYQFAHAQGVQTIMATPAADGLSFDIHITAAATAVWPAGPYTWRARVKQGDDVYTVGEGLCTVAPALTAGVDARSPARRALDQIKEYLANPNSIACQSYTIKGRSLSQYPLPELWQHHDRLVVEVSREDARRNGKGMGGRIQVRFCR